MTENFADMNELYSIIEILKVLNQVGYSIGVSDIDVFDSNGEQLGTIQTVNNKYVFRLGEE